MAANSDKSRETEQAKKTDTGYIGPITHEILTGGHESPLMREFHAALKNPGDYVLLWAGAYRGHPNTQTTLSWGWRSVNTGSPPPVSETAGGDQPLPRPMDPASPARTERMLAPLAHEARLRLMQALLSDSRTPSQLSAQSGMKGGNLYYHLKELIHAGYIEERDGNYALTGLGRQLFVTLTCIASVVVKDRGVEGLAVIAPKTGP